MKNPFMIFSLSFVLILTNAACPLLADNQMADMMMNPNQTPAANPVPSHPLPPAHSSSPLVSGPATSTISLTPVTTVPDPAADSMSTGMITMDHADANMVSTPPTDHLSIKMDNPTVVAHTHMEVGYNPLANFNGHYHMAITEEIPKDLNNVGNVYMDQKGEGKFNVQVRETPGNYFVSVWPVGRDHKARDKAVSVPIQIVANDGKQQLAQKEERNIKEVKLANAMAEDLKNLRVKSDEDQKGAQKIVGEAIAQQGKKGPPNINIITPAVNEALVGAQVEIVYERTGNFSAVSRCVFQIDSKMQEDYSLNELFSFNGVKPGVHLLSGYLVDSEDHRIEGTEFSIPFTTQKASS